MANRSLPQLKSIRSMKSTFATPPPPIHTHKINNCDKRNTNVRRRAQQTLDWLMHNIYLNAMCPRPKKRTVPFYCCIVFYFKATFQSVQSIEYVIIMICDI